MRLATILGCRTTLAVRVTVPAIFSLGVSLCGVFESGLRNVNRLKVIDPNRFVSLATGSRSHVEPLHRAFPMHLH